jgi:hypothetical protein
MSEREKPNFTKRRESLFPQRVSIESDLYFAMCPLFLTFLLVLSMEYAYLINGLGEYCPEEPVEQQICQEGFQKINETATGFICQASSASEWKASWYSVYNDTAVDYLGSRWWARGFFQNQVEIGGLTVRGCFQKGLYGNNWIWFFNPDNTNSNPAGSIEPDPVGSNSYENWVVSFRNGSVKGERGEMAVSLPYEMEVNLRITGFISKEN